MAVDNLSYSQASRASPESKRRNDNAQVDKTSRKKPKLSKETTKSVDNVVNSSADEDMDSSSTPVTPKGRELHAAKVESRIATLKMYPSALRALKLSIPVTPKNWERKVLALLFKWSASGASKLSASKPISGLGPIATSASDSVLRSTSGATLPSQWTQTLTETDNDIFIASRLAKYSGDYAVLHPCSPTDMIDYETLKRFKFHSAFHIMCYIKSLGWARHGAIIKKNDNEPMVSTSDVLYDEDGNKAQAFDELLPTA